jgi:hypothetical protein
MNNIETQVHICFRCYEKIRNDLGLYKAFFWEQSCFAFHNKEARIFYTAEIDILEDLERKGYISVFELSPDSFAIKANGFKEIIRKQKFINYFCVGMHETDEYTFPYPDDKEI